MHTGAFLRERALPDGIKEDDFKFAKVLETATDRLDSGEVEYPAENAIAKVLRCGPFYIDTCSFFSNILD